MRPPRQTPARRADEGCAQQAGLIPRQGKPHSAPHCFSSRPLSVLRATLLRKKALRPDKGRFVSQKGASGVCPGGSLLAPLAGSPPPSSQRLAGVCRGGSPLPPLLPPAVPCPRQPCGCGYRFADVIYKRK